MKNLVEVRTPTVDRFGEPAIEVRYVYKEPDINAYIAARNGKAYDDKAMSLFVSFQIALFYIFLYTVLVPFVAIRKFFTRKNK